MRLRRTTNRSVRHFISDSARC